MIVYNIIFASPEEKLHNIILKKHTKFISEVFCILPTLHSYHILQIF